MELRIDGVTFEVAQNRQGEDIFALTKRFSQRGDPSALHVAEWRVDGPDLNSSEWIAPGAASGYLGRDYGINTDGRFEGVDTLGPLINTVTLSTYDIAYSGVRLGTSTAKLGSTFRFGNAPAATFATGAEKFGSHLYVLRQQHPAKVQISDMTLKFMGLTLNDVATDIVHTISQTDAAPDELSIAMGASPYVVLTGAGSHPNPDTWSTNSSDVIQRVFGVAPDRIVGMRQQVVQGNILTGMTTMASPNWQTVATLRNKEVRFNSFALDGNLWVLGTSNGPYMLDGDSGEFFPLIDEIDNDHANTDGMTTWFPLGVVIPLRDGLRFQKNRRGDSFGPEVFDGNESPIQGHVHGVAGSTRWLYTTVHNDIDNSLWLLAWGKWHPGDPTRHAHVLAPHVIARLGSSGEDSKFLKYIGRANGLRTRETLVGGLDGNLFHMAVGLTSREIDDTSYNHAASGTSFYTELRRHPGLVKDIEYFEFESNDCGNNDTLTVGVAMDGKAAVTMTGRLTDYDGSTMNGVVKTDGLQRIHAILDDGSPRVDVSGYRFKPQMAFARGSTTTVAPQVVGTLRVHYRTRAKQTRTIQADLVLRESTRWTKEELRDKLLDLWDDRPSRVLMGREEMWVAVDDVQIQGDRARVTLTEWALPRNFPR